MTNNNQTIPDPVTDELLDWILGRIDHVARSATGLTEEQARTPVVPSGWTVAGLLGHLQDTTHFWLHHVVAGHPMDFGDEDAWDNDPACSLAELIDRLRTDASDCRGLVANVASTDAPGWWPEGAWGGYRQDTVRGVLLHLLNEIASHSGHLDIARELLDGGVWDFSINGVRLPDRE